MTERTPDRDHRWFGARPGSLRATMAGATMRHDAPDWRGRVGTMGCEAHPAAEASRRCEGCAKLWCEACARAVGLTHHVVCPACGHRLARFAAPQGALQTVSSSVRRVISTEGITAALGFAILFGLGSTLYAVLFIYLAALVGYYFVIVHHVGGGQPGLPSPGDRVDHWGDVVTRAGHGLLCASLGFAPLVLWGVLADEPADHRLLLGLLVVGQLYMPAVVLSVAVTGSGWAAIWPPTWLRVIARAPGAYVRFIGLWLAAVLVGFAMVLVTAPLLASVWGSFVAAVGWNVFWFAHAALVGEFIRANAEAFGWD